jgi:AraC-like DNA-binding protein
LQTTPTAWLEERRLERAGILLARTDRPLLDIALGLGFGSLSYFHRQFRKRFATTPMAWRQAQVRAV